MEFTGERYVPTVEGQLKYEHVHRYDLASAFGIGRTILDLASGEGYGAAILASVGQSVVGVDSNPEVIAHAARSYPAKNLSFIVGSCDAVPLPGAAFDMVTSFETIEHHDKHDEMLREIKRLLKPDGILIISSPNKLSYSDESGYANPFHVKELYYEEFRRLLGRHFRHLRFYGQRFTTGSFMYPLLENGDNAWSAWDGNASRIVPSVKALPTPVYFIAVCSDSLEIDAIDFSSVYLDQDDAILEDWEKTRTGSKKIRTRSAPNGGGPACPEVDDLLAKLEKARVEKARMTLARRGSLDTIYRQSNGAFRAKVKHTLEVRGLQDQVTLLTTQLQEKTSALDDYHQQRLEAEAKRPSPRSLFGRFAAYISRLRGQELEDQPFQMSPGMRQSGAGAPSSSQTPVDTMGPIRGFLDYPREGESVFGTTEITGWVHSTAAPITQVDVSIDGVALAALAHGTARPDVPASFPDKPLACGFQGKVFIDDQEPDGDGQLKIRALDAAGNVWVFTRKLLICARLRGMLDPIVPTAGPGFIEISGWSFSVAAVTTVEAWIDDLYLGNVRYGVDRPDVISSFPEAPLACGFRERIFIEDLQLCGEKTLSIEVSDANGNSARYTCAIVFSSSAYWSVA